MFEVLERANQLPMELESATYCNLPPVFVDSNKFEFLRFWVFENLLTPHTI